MNFNKYEFFKFLKKKLTFIQKDEINFILEECDYDFLWEYLINIKKENYYNFIISLRLFINFSEKNINLTNIEKKVYENKNLYEIFFLMIKTLEIIISNNINEMTKTDLNIINKKLWVCINLSSLYFISLNHLDISKLTEKKKNPNLYKKIIEINLIVSTLERLEQLYFYTKLKKNDDIYPNELLESINFTEGYLICFSPNLVDIIKNYKYLRKLINREPIKIICFKKKINFLESLEEKNFNTNFWMNNKNFNILNNKNLLIYNKKLLKKECKINICINSLNYLNSTELIYNKDILNSIITIINNNTLIDKTLSTKVSLENYILKINKEMNSNEYLEEFTNIKTLIQSASILELIKKQLNYYKSFFLEHKLDHRLRIYCYPWPINYQLNHVIRSILIFKDNINICEIWNNFWKHPLIKKYIKNKNIFEFMYNNEAKIWIENFFINKKINSKNDIEDLLKKEFFYQTLLKISPNDIKYEKDKFNFSIEILEDFTKDDIEKKWNFWSKKMKIKQKKLPYLINYHHSLKNLMKNNFESIFWADASSNAIQLIFLRLKIRNPFLLKLANIYNNDTKYNNIYDYITEEIKQKNHEKIIKKLNNKLNKEEINNLQDIDNNKYLLMPSSYGMGKFAYRKSLNEMLTNDEREEIWNKLEKKEKAILSDYFWETADEILNKLGFNLSEYKEICKKLYEKTNYNVFIWKNDLGITISPISIKNSKRHEIMKKINILKLKIKEKIEKEDKDVIKEEIKKLNEKLKKDDKNFWKRSMIITNKNKIFSRIYFKEKYDVDKRDTRQSIIPNSIHAYDASIMHLVILICKKLNIKILVIHDSIGCHILLIPIIKIIFKIANILLLEINSNKKIFPLNNISKEEDLEKMIEEIIKSKNFFR